MVAVSSVVRTEALARKDRELNERSQFPVLVKELGDKVVAPGEGGRGRALGRARRGRSRRWCAPGSKRRSRCSATPRRRRRRSNGSRPPSSGSSTCADPGARWSTIVSDRTADLSNNVMFDFRGRHAPDLAQHGRGDREPHQGRRVGRHGARPPGRRRRRGHSGLRRPRGGAGRDPRRGRRDAGRGEPRRSTSVPART